MLQAMRTSILLHYAPQGGGVLNPDLETIISFTPTFISGETVPRSQT